MSTERSDQIYSHYMEATQKFDYFVLGVCITLVGYLGSTLEPTVIDLTSAGLQAIAAVVFLLAALCGFERLEDNLVLLKLMQRRLRSEESAGAMAEVARSGASALNTATGEVLTPRQAMDRYLFHSAGAEVTAEQLDNVIRRSANWYAARNWLLFGGMVVLLASRLLPAYVAK